MVLEALSLFCDTATSSDRVLAALGKSPMALESVSPFVTPYVMALSETTVSLGASRGPPAFSVVCNLSLVVSLAFVLLFRRMFPPTLLGVPRLLVA